MSASAQVSAVCPLQARVLDRSLVRHQLFIAGRWQDARNGATFDVHDPATGTVLGCVALGGAADAHVAIGAASAVWPVWRSMTPQARGAILRRWAELMRAAREDLACIMTLEQGKPLDEARGEIEYAATFLDWFAEEGRRAYGETLPSHISGCRLLTTRQPVGVVAAITPWNFPAAMITRKAGAALAAGCPVVVKPADETPFSALALAALAQRAGVPDGVFSVITGDARQICGELTTSEIVRAVSFTGSTEVGRVLLRQCADTVKRVSLELGGHAPFIAFADFDPYEAAELAVAAKFQSSGQDCLAANRIYVQREIYETFTKRFVALAAELRVGSGLEPGTAIGPLISPRAIGRCERQVADAVERGAQLVLGGKRHRAGLLFFEPTVLCDVTDDMLISREETFGPVAAIAPFDTEAEVVERANATQYGLAAYLMTRDIARALRVGEQLEFGMVAVNTDRFSGAPIPFGGMKQSGLGREGSRHGLDEFSEIKYLCIDVETA